MTSTEIKQQWPQWKNALSDYSSYNSQRKNGLLVLISLLWIKTYVKHKSTTDAHMDMYTYTCLCTHTHTLPAFVLCSLDSNGTQKKTEWNFLKTDIHQKCRLQHTLTQLYCHYLLCFTWQSLFWKLDLLVHCLRNVRNSGRLIVLVLTALLTVV